MRSTGSNKLRLIAIAFSSWLLGASGDPGVLLELDRDAYLVLARDLRAGVSGPALRVAVGSPAHPTPTGSFPLREVVHNPGWVPGPNARRNGARPEPPSLEGPLGAAKIPFLGAFSLHGGSRPLLLGKPITLGCLRSADPQLLELLGWLGQQGALGDERPLATGEILQSFVRPARLVIR
jgi:hypothetical protein